MMRRMAKRLAFVAVAVAFLGCNEKTTSIKTLLDDPGRFDGKTVRIAGEVQQSIGALGYGAYQVKDATGELPVITEGGGAPARGTQVGVEGTFRAAYTLGTESRAVIIEKRRINR